MRKWETELRDKASSARTKTIRPPVDSRRPPQPSPKESNDNKETSYSLRSYLKEHGLVQYYRVLTI